MADTPTARQGLQNRHENASPALKAEVPISKSSVVSTAGAASPGSQLHARSGNKCSPFSKDRQVLSVPSS